MSIVVNNTGNQLNVTNNGVLDVYAVQSIKSIGRGIDSSGDYYVSINFIANDKNNSFRIYLKDVSSPSTWTNDNSGVNTALSDLRGWLSSSSSVSSTVRIQDGVGNPLTSTSIGSDTALDVNIVGGASLSVNLSQTSDQVQVYGSDLTAPIATDTAGHLQVDILTVPEVEIKNDSGNPITVSANDLDIRNLTFASDKVDISGSSVTANAGTGNFNVAQATASSLNATVVGGTGVQRTPFILRTSANSSVAEGAYSVSFASVGTANATVGGAVLKPGETINFDAGAINNTLGSIAYNSSASGAELLIITLT